MTFCPNAQRELEIYFDNCQWLAKPAWQALSRHHKGGQFDQASALKFLEVRYREAAKQYVREHGSSADTWHQMFSVADRKACALATLEGMLAEFKLGNYWD